MKPIYKSLVLAATTLQISLALNAETRDDESASTMALQAELLDSLRVKLVAQGVSGARDLINSGECVIEGSNLTVNLDTTNWTEGSTYRVQVLATFGTQTQVIYALIIAVPRYVALSDEMQEFEDDVTIVSTITDVTKADLEGLALEATSQEIKAAITPISTAAEAYNVGKTQLAAAITSKGVETSPTESYPEMAEKVNAIAQETYEINGGEMYAKQLFGSLETPNYWNLYEVLAQLLSDGRLVQYGGILLAEYYRGYDSIALSGAGASGAYVVSDKDSDGNFIMYTDDTTHTWDTEFDGKGNRWVAYCFADEYHDFQITDTNTSPRSIFIGRKVGTITSLVAGRVSQIVVPDGNKLRTFDTGDYVQNWTSRVVVRNVENSRRILYDTGTNVSSFYIEAEQITGNIIQGKAGSANLITIPSIIIKAPSLQQNAFVYTKADVVCIDSETIITSATGVFGYMSSTKRLIIINVETISGDMTQDGAISEYIYIGYKTNDKTKSVVIKSSASNVITAPDIELKNGWCKPLNVAACKSLTEANIYAHILQRLKQDEPDCGDGVTITLGSTNLAKLTSDESVQLLDDLTNIYGYTFA